MATKAEVDFAVNGEKILKEKQNKVEDSIISSINHDNNALADVKYHVFKLVNNTRKGGVYLPNIDDVVNPDTITKEKPKGTVERMRLLSGVSSVWLKDQKDLSPDYVKNNGRSPHFVRGTRLLQVSENDETMLKFMQLSSHNIGSRSKKMGSPYEFYEFDAAKEERMAFEKEDFELEMAIAAKQEKPDAMKKHAAFLGIRLINDLGLPKGEEGIRTEYVRYAKRNPSYFKDTLGSKEVEIGWLIRKGITDSLIEIGREPGKIHWANGGGMICVIPQNTDTVKYLVELAMTNSEDGKRFLEQLTKTIK